MDNDKTIRLGPYLNCVESYFLIIFSHFRNDYNQTNFSLLTPVFIGFHEGQLFVFFSQRVTEEGKTPAANGFFGFWFAVAGLWGNLLGFFYFNPNNLQSINLLDAAGKNR